ncbi:hypothetical protein [Natronoglycomyces albus]|uniref:Uncharacterized protein n=1 Tax=Natronoglycomyces albus TaxID=2811108 RepID=A0A895XNC9_9ACTN|nr:hypothetical protein [Natronoglycomyces albus]QSB07151.1 hypothetical protein JQS30_17055 [Natronoglycomyces albus]
MTYHTQNLANNLHYFHLGLDEPLPCEKCETPVRQARERGLSWSHLAPLMNRYNLIDRPTAEAAWQWFQARTYTEDVCPHRASRLCSWKCTTCDQCIEDLGPSTAPHLGEIGHTETCARHQADLRAYLPNSGFRLIPAQGMRHRLAAVQKLCQTVNPRCEAIKAALRAVKNVEQALTAAENHYGAPQWVAANNKTHLEGLLRIEVHPDDADAVRNLADALAEDWMFRGVSHHTRSCLTAVQHNLFEDAARVIPGLAAILTHEPTGKLEELNKIFTHHRNRSKLILTPAQGRAHKRWQQAMQPHLNSEYTHHSS